MRPVPLLPLLCLCLIPLSAHAASYGDVVGSVDYPTLPRLEGFYIDRYFKRETDRRDFILDEVDFREVEGRSFVITYALRSGSRTPGAPAIARAYEAKVKRLGGEVLWAPPGEGDDFRVVTFVVPGPTGEVWITLDAWDDHYVLTIVEQAGDRDRSDRARLDGALTPAG